MRRLLAIATFLCLLFCLADTQASTGKKMNVQGESLVFVTTEPGKLCFDRVSKGSLTLRSTYVAGKPGGITYNEGRDYVVDYAAGTITRCANSRIPDYSTNCLYGQKDFDHTKFPSFRNHEWFVWADYRTTNGKPWAKPNDHNRGTAEPEKFKNNLVTLAKMIRERKAADVILFSTFPPNDHWLYGTHRMAQFAAATRQAAAEAGCAYGDAFATWELVLQRKDQSPLLDNNINHPNDFGHWLYEQAFEAMKF